jgi:acyl-CoA synthetase (AMP-forming)/AMP-acid ligase II
MLASTEFAHVGVMTKLPWQLRRGMTIHMLVRWRAADALRVIAAERIPTVGGIPAQIALMLRDPEFASLDLSHVRSLVVGGGPSWRELVEEARRRFGASYSVRYSSTESGGVGTVADDDDAPDTVGRPREGVEVEIRDREVWLRSPAVMTGYWRNPEATSETIVDGWLRTGDVGYLEDRGRLHLSGRSSEAYIRGGYNVLPLEVEAVLRSHPLVADVAVIPRSDAVMGEVGVAVVVPADPARPPGLEDLRAFASDRLAHHKLPEALRITEALPLTSMHKIDRRRLAADEERRTARAANP